MPDSTVDDGKGESWERELSQQHFEDFVVALLRSLASGDDSYRVREQFFRFLKHTQESGVPIGPVFQAALRDLNDRAIPVPQHVFVFGRDDTNHPGCLASSRRACLD
jgi:hypothetical protein